jgi:hypothetical protein
MRPQPVGEGGCPGLGPSSWQSRSISALALRRWGKCAWSLLLSHHRLDRYRLVALTRPWVLLVHARDLFVYAKHAGQVPFINRRNQRRGANSRRLALTHGPVIGNIVDVLEAGGPQ